MNRPGDGSALTTRSRSAEIRQAGAEGIVTALHHVPAGEIWPLEEIQRRQSLIAASGLKWSVAESIPVHEDIKTRTGRFSARVENYRQSIRNLGKCGIPTVCYNFMPLLDWSRTDLRIRYRDGSVTTGFESRAFAAFDLFVLKRPGAEGEYSEEMVREAKAYLDGLPPGGRERLVETVLLGMPGSLEAYSLDGLRSALRSYEGIGASDLRDHLYHFLREIIPAAEESGVAMGIHPDDPPRSLLGLPRVVCDASDIEGVLGVVDSPSNGLTFCTGSLGAGPQNNVAQMAERFSARVNFIHLRNVSRTTAGDFVEENHLEGDVDMYAVMRAMLLEQKRRRDEGRPDVRMPMRPDHGHLMIPDEQKKGIYPGYSLFGRMRGLAELRGLELGISRSLGL